ncbi:MAG: transcriptional regulator [Pyrinomonadaceae bacterium]|nr:transcriptional regulator [Pyrinomonadaceae bacterium]
MGNPKKTNEIYRFGMFSLDAAERRLWREDERIQLTPKQFDLLFYFVENAGHVAKKNELLDAVWADTYIEENTLARNISWLRQLLGDGADGEPIIETVPKLGYRFTAEVTRPNENLLIVEEETVQYTRGEEIITINDDFGERRGEWEKRRKGERKINSFPQLLISPSPRLFLIVFGIIALVGGGYFLYRNKEKSGKSPTRSRTAAAPNPTRQQINIGSIVHLQNRYPNDGSYLDAWGDVWSKPEFEKVPTETMFVSTHKKNNRDNGSGSWEIVSADGKSSGETLAVGDRIHLKNMYPNAGYLDSCGWVEHLPIFDKFLDQTGAVFTTRSQNRDNGTGVWIIRSANGEDGTPVFEGDSIAIESSYFINDKGINRVSGFLNVTGKVKDIPSFNDYDGFKLVFTQSISYNQSVPDIWTITISKAVLE